MRSARLGRRLRGLRMAAEITQAQAAEALGVTQRTISDYELGRRSPTPDTIRRIEAMYRGAIAPQGASE